MLEHVAHGEVRGGQVVVAGGGEDAQRLVVLRSLRQRAGDVDVAGEGAAPVGGALPLLVGLAILRRVPLHQVDAELVAEIVLEQGDVDRSGLGVEGVIVRKLRHAVDLGLHVAPVQDAHRLPLVAQQLLGESRRVDPQIGAKDVLLRDSGVAVHPFGDPFLLRFR